MYEYEIGYEQFPEEFNAENTFICGTSEKMLDVAKKYLKELNCSNKTVLITDPYLFPESYKKAYKNDLITLFTYLNASKIVYCSNQIKNNTFFELVRNALASNNIILEYTNTFEECHDRFWLCPETNKCVVFGTSMNGIGKKICRIDFLNDEEIGVLKSYFIKVGIL